MRKLLLFGVAAAAAVTGTTVATAATGAPTSEGTAVIVVHARTTAFSELDLGASGYTPGDEAFRKDSLTDRAGADVGVLNSECTNLIPGDPYTENDQLCTGVITLTGRGKIHWQSLAVSTPPPPPGGRPSARPPLLGSPWAILGGSGDFRDARGQILDVGTSAADHYLRVQLSR